MQYIVFSYTLETQEIKKLNSELLNSNTYPIILNKSIIEIDTKKDLKNFINTKKN